MQALQRRATAVQWIRKTHGWIGLWGAILGLLFGTAGILAQPRAVLQAADGPSSAPTPSWRCPTRAGERGRRWRVWLQAALDQDRPPNSVRTEPGATGGLGRRRASPTR